MTFRFLYSSRLLQIPRTISDVQNCTFCLSKAQYVPRRGSRYYFEEENQRQKDDLIQEQVEVPSPNAQRQPYVPPDMEDYKEMSARDLLKGAKVQNAPVPEVDFPSDLPAQIERKKQIRQMMRDQKKHAYRPKVDARDTTILLFPGQGAQYVGMGKGLLGYPNVEDMYTIASDILGYDLLDVCLKGPEKTLSQTIYQQPAVVVTALAAIEKLKATNPAAVANCVSTAGFSVGEYAALTFAGVFSFQDAIHLVKVRAKAMQEASQMTNSGMMTVFLGASSKLGHCLHTAREYCLKRLDIPDPVCIVANYLYPEVKVIAGHMEALQFVEENGRSFGVKRTRYLPVSGAFHTHLMHSAQKPLRQALDKVDMNNPIIPVHSNVSSFRYGNVKHIKKLLVEQVCRPVKWEQIMHVLYARKQGEYFPQTFELGPGKQLGTLLKMTNFQAHQSYSSVEV